MAPAAAVELRVQVSRSVVGQYESVGITVTDPLNGLDIKPGPLQVTMADGADHRVTVWLPQADQPGKWSGRFTPTRTGRHTGAVVLERRDQKDLGLVPLIRVRASKRPGFVRQHPSSRRVLRWSSGGALFPMGVRISAEDVEAGVDWHAELAALRGRGLNWVDAQVPWPGALSDEEQQTALRSVDQLLVEAERQGGMAVHLRLQPPSAAPDSEAYAAQLKEWVARWAYSPALAGWCVAGAVPDAPADDRVRWVRAVREADGYGHLVTVPGTPGEVHSGADLVVSPSTWDRPSSRLALFDAFPQTGPTPLPGENTWQMLVAGGLGLPVVPYHPGAPDASLFQLSRMAEAARSLQLTQPVVTVTGLLRVDAPGSVARYGKSFAGWVMPGEDRVLSLPGLPRGRYRARFWDPASGNPAGQDALWSSGAGVRLALPPALRAVYFQVDPSTAAPASTKSRTARRASQKTARKVKPRRSTRTVRSSSRSKRVARSRSRRRRR
jgi:hypothetical protein